MIRVRAELHRAGRSKNSFIGAVLAENGLVAACPPAVGNFSGKALGSLIDWVAARKGYELVIKGTTFEMDPDPETQVEEMEDLF